MRLWDKSENARDLASQGIEVWAPVHLAPGRYYVSNLGNMMSDVAGRGFKPLSPSLNPAGRPSVSIYVKKGDRSSLSCLVYRLMLWAFDGPPPSEEHTDACHGPTGEADNRLCNLRWGTRSENMLDVIKHKREEKQPFEHPGTKKWYEGYLADNEMIERTLSLYDRKQLTIADFALIWNCSTSSASNIISGRTQKTLKRPQRARQNGRVGENHYRSVVSDAELAEALQRYVDNHWSGVQFSKYLEIKQVTADAILSGRNRTNVPRPLGFKYPWPDARTMNAKGGEDHNMATISEAEILAVFARVESGEFKDMKEVQAALGVSRGITYSVVAGRSWEHLPRSDKFKAEIAKIQRTLLSLEEQHAIVADLMAGMNRNDVKAKYNLSDSKIASYVTKVNKMKAAATSP